MDTQAFYTRQMLLQYGRQLVAARRLARYDQLLGRGPNAGPAAMAAKRQIMIERIAREIVDNLIFSGSENPIVLEVKKALSEERGEELIFRYPPGDLDVRVLRTDELGNEVEVTSAEKRAIMEQLWGITLRTVDATML